MKASNYNFKNYWKCRYSSLLAYKRMIEDEVKCINEKFVKRDIQNGSVAMPTIVYNDLCKYHAELEYLHRVILVRKFWRPIDWWKKVKEFFGVCSCNTKTNYPNFGSYHCREEYEEAFKSMK